ncbi:enoyl-CoA hydratase/isomerase family protein [Maritalea sp.]|uniref:enoyl-CoA hydratase/isomerase family protein n=1 Tax=Maritalea sp. TaxID=2003361 RepID=UPI003EFA6094
MSDLIVQQHGDVGVITLNRPNALNALSHAMVDGMTDALKAWADDDSIRCVLIDGAGERAFCAGGDIQAIYENGRKDPVGSLKFWRDEYQLNAMIANYKKPYIALMHGFTMGGGVGVSAHGSHRIVTDSSIISMPEVGIGFLPDVGGTWLLHNAPKGVGAYYGISGARMGPDDAIFLNFADAYVPQETFATIKDRLIKGADIDDLLAEVSQKPKSGEARLHQTAIACWFETDNVEQVLANIEADGSAFAQGALKLLKRQCPLSVKSTFYALQKAANFSSVEQSLQLELRFCAASLQGENFYEGIRAAIIDKDRNPQWAPASLAEVSDKMVKDMFAPLGDNELVF